MKYFITVIILTLVAVFPKENPKSVTAFAKTQKDTYTEIAFDKSGNFTYLLEKLQLHSSKTQLRLKAKTRHANKQSYYKQVYSRINLWQYNYATKESCKQAIDSLVTCFPSECVTVKGKANMPLKVTPSIWVLSDKTIYIAQTNCEHIDDDWTLFKSEFVTALSSKNSQQMETACGVFIGVR